MSGNFFVDQGTVQKLIPQLAPLILAGLKKQKDTRGGDDVAGFLMKGGTTRTQNRSILGSLPGGLTRRR